MTSRRHVISAQIDWAKLQGHAPDSRGYLPTYQANLHRPLSTKALGCFTKGSGNELRDTRKRPAKMRALHSSSALVVNVFDGWCDAPDKALQVLGLPTGAVQMEFEAQLPTGLDGKPPNLDLCIWWADGTVLGVESKFTEWLTPKSPGKELFKDKYFPADRKLWAAKGLSRCQELARLLRDGRLVYRHLDAAQLLKHILGLASTARRFELCYLYFDVQGKERGLHAAEIHDFRNRLGADLPFHVGTYQSVFEKLRVMTSASEAHVRYLASRYMSAQAAPATRLAVL